MVPEGTTRLLGAGPTPARTMTFHYPRGGWTMHHYSRPGESHAQCMSPWRGAYLERERPRRWRQVRLNEWSDATGRAPGSLQCAECTSVIEQPEQPEQPTAPHNAS